MEWRNSISSPQGFRYFLITFDSTAELLDYSLPEWFDSNKHGIIGIYYLEDVPTIVVVDGPDTTEGVAWYGDLGYALLDIGPLAEQNLKVRYVYNSTTYLAFVRNPALDSFKGGKRMLAWTIADTNWDTVWTDTIDCTTTTKLWVINEGVWSESTNATISNPVWTDDVSVLVEVEAESLGSGSVHIDVNSGDYYNSVKEFVGCTAYENETYTIEVTGSGWKWEDTDTSESPRTITSSKWGDFFKIVNA